MDIYVKKFFYFLIFSSFQYALIILPVSQLQIQQLITSQILGHTYKIIIFSC